MTSLTTTFRLPEPIAAHLAAGVYERVGGVVRDSQTKQVVMWLRETGQMNHLPGAIPSVLSSLGAMTSLLNLGVSTMGFALILQRLEGIERQIDHLGELIKIGFHAKCVAAIELAAHAVRMTDAANRRQMAIEAIALLTEARGLLVPLLDAELAQGSSTVPSYLAALSLTYISEARCYLEIEEAAIACRLLEHAAATLEPRVRQHVQTLLTAQPAAYLHSSLKRTIPRHRILNVLCWANPDLKKRGFLRSVPPQLAALEAQSIEWIDSLPKAIWNPAIDDQESWAGWAIRQPGLLLAPWLPSGWVHKQAQQASIIEHRLPKVFQTIETLIEGFQRLQIYSLEIRATQQLAMSFDSWQQLAPAEEKPPAPPPLMYIVFAEPLLLKQS